MAEHRIRFRGGWEIQTGDVSGPVKHLILPTYWPGGLEGTCRLIRRFGRPPNAFPNEVYRIELINVSGIALLRLNGFDLDLTGSESGDLLVTLFEPLRDRNTLEIEVDLSRVSRERLVRGWGAIALVIESKAAQ